MSGYHGWSMSNNAVDAYSRGLMPLTKWTKPLILKRIEHLGYNSEFFKKWNSMELKTLLYSPEWHHTGGAFNNTNFYDIDTDAVVNYLNGVEKPIIKTEKKEKLIEDDGFWHGKYKCTEFHPTSSYNKYKIWYEEFENAKRKGDWIILSNGVKKKFSNCIDVTYTKFKRRKKK